MSLKPGLAAKSLSRKANAMVDAAFTFPGHGSDLAFLMPAAVWVP
jgi:hypothetical protein